MAQCGCGRQLNESDKLCHRCAALRALGLEQGASRNEIRDAYRDLVKVWHPDRFPNDVKLHSKAEEKLKEVNAAFQRLNSSVDSSPARAASAAKNPEEKPESQKPNEAPKGSTRASQSSSTSARETPRPHASAQETPRKDSSASGFPNAARPQPNSNARPPSPTPEANRPINKGAPSAFFSLRRIPHWLVLALSVVFTRMWIDACKKPTADQNAMVNRYNEARSNALRHLQSVPDINVTSPSPPSSPKQDQKRLRTTASSATLSENEDKVHQQVPSSSQKVRGTRGQSFTMGSTVNEVLAIEGTPSDIIGDMYFWGTSSVTFRSGRVIGWQNSPSNPLKVTLASDKQASSSGFFTKGSTVDEVLAIEGTPTDTLGDVSYSGMYFWGTSSVTFSSGRVVGWKSSRFNPLKVKSE